MSAFLTNPINKYNHIHSRNVPAIILLRSHKRECHASSNQNVEMWATVSSGSSWLAMKSSLIKKCRKKKVTLTFWELKYKCRHTFFYFCGNEEGINVTTCSLKRKESTRKEEFLMRGCKLMMAFPNTTKAGNTFYSQSSIKDQGDLAERNCLHFQIPQIIFISFGIWKPKAKVSDGFWEKYIWLFEVRMPQKILDKKSFYWAWSTNNFDNAGSTHQSQFKIQWLWKQSIFVIWCSLIWSPYLTWINLRLFIIFLTLI